MPPAGPIRGLRLELSWVESAAEEVPLAKIFVSQLWTPTWPGANGKLAEKEVLRDPSIIHPTQMP